MPAMSASLKTTLRLLDHIDAHPAPWAEPSASLDWEGRPEQWCALLDRLARNEGKVMPPETIAKLVLDHVPSGGLNVPWKRSVDLITCGLSEAEGQATIPGWESSSLTGPVQLWLRPNYVSPYDRRDQPLTFVSEQERQQIFSLAYHRARIHFGALLLAGALFCGLISHDPLLLAGVMGSYLVGGFAWIRYIQHRFVARSLLKVQSKKVAVTEVELLAKVRLAPGLDKYPAEYFARETPAPNRFQKWAAVPGLQNYVQSIQDSEVHWMHLDTYLLNLLMLQDEARQTRNAQRVRQCLLDTRGDLPPCVAQ